MERRPFGLVIHGGAGVIEREDMSAELDVEYRSALQRSLDAGYGVLEGGGSAMDAVVAAVTLMEDCPLFNAGKGSVFNGDGRIEMDASLMDGTNLKAGAVAGLQHVKNPIQLARDVMDKSPHVFLIGSGAEQFAWTLGYQKMPAEYFMTEGRREQLRRAESQMDKKNFAATLAVPDRPVSLTPEELHLACEQKYGTVGCVALDQDGNLASGTSTGGMTNKKYGRVGDSPIIGAGTYANNNYAAISSTGSGEYFIRVVAAYDISAQMEYQNKPIRAAAASTLEKIAKLGGNGGVIGIDSLGNVMTDFNSKGMYRAYRVSGQDPVVAIYSDEPR